MCFLSVLVWAEREKRKILLHFNQQLCELDRWSEFSVGTSWDWTTFNSLRSLWKKNHFIFTGLQLFHAKKNSVLTPLLHIIIISLLFNIFRECWCVCVWRCLITNPSCCFFFSGDEVSGSGSGSGYTTEFEFTVTEAPAVGAGRQDQATPLRPASDKATPLKPPSDSAAPLLVSPITLMAVTLLQFWWR